MTNNTKCKHSKKWMYKQEGYPAHYFCVKCGIIYNLGKNFMRTYKLTIKTKGKRCCCMFKDFESFTADNTCPNCGGWIPHAKGDIS